VVQPLEPNPVNLMEARSPGSIADVTARLWLWAAREGKGIAHVEYSSEFSRQRVVDRIQPELNQAGIGVSSIELPANQSATAVVQYLLDELAQVAVGEVVWVTGFARAFGAGVRRADEPQEATADGLRILNFNREALTAFPVRQVWWMTPVVWQAALYGMPDLHGWFSPKLRLTESISAGMIESLSTEAPSSRESVADAYARTEKLLAQFRQAQIAGAADLELLTTYLLPALENLAEVGAHQKLQDLTLQFEGILSEIKEIDRPEIGICLGRLGNLYREQGRYREAEPLLLKSLKLSKLQQNNSTGLGLTEKHPVTTTATSLNNLAGLYRSQGRYGEAEPLLVEALEISKAELGNRHPSTATSLNNLALLYESQGRYGEAEPLYVEALEIKKAELGDRHPDTATSLNNLATLYESQGRYVEAEPLFIEALEICKAELGDRHPSTTTNLNNLAALYRSEGRYDEAEPLLMEALEIKKAELGDRHLSTATSLNNLALLYYATDRIPEAAEMMSRVISIFEEILDPNHPNILGAHGNLNVIQQKLNI
jgi:tetratricopeptide (TPR) repeat protein